MRPILLALFAGLLNLGATAAWPSPDTPAPGSLADQLSRPWARATGPTDAAQFERDKSGCASVARQTPVGEQSAEIVFEGSLIECLKSRGYEPQERPAAPAVSSAAQAQALAGTWVHPSAGGSSDGFQSARRKCQSLADYGISNGAIVSGDAYADDYVACMRGLGYVPNPQP
jgi:hypothetical protein